ncbi:hypothetical protein HCN44_006863 [Aphidius gifuensis]|uniref:Carotenoid isomerooxygenase n=1 Tax=Aphidius gifuensis TaxID=684658 RepID=A0A834XZK0_APHGI|nr:hypothetical protein HCN44_006863 [Aphidius gifuensis]
MSSEKFQVINHYLNQRYKKHDIKNENKLLQNKNNDDYYWPNTDSTIWMRSCENETIKPISGKITGKIPNWIKGSLLRNGPGCLKVGDYTFEHLFDSSALLHRFHINNGKITYQNRFIQTNVYKKNKQAQRIVLTEFGTRSVPDPCQTIFKRKTMFDNAKIISKIPARWKLNPAYMHTFGITDNFFIIIEQPLAISLINMLGAQLKNKPLATCLKWHDDENTLFHIISRKNGKIVKTFTAEAFFFFHIINQYESKNSDKITIDICCYRDANMLDCMYVDAMKNMHKNPNYAQLFRGRPLRFILPMNNKFTTDKEINTDNVLKKKSSAHKLDNGSVFIKPELLCNLGCETPRYNQTYLGKKYRYFYAISTDVDVENPGAVIKVDTKTKKRKIFYEKNLYPSEPIFVPRPDAKDEDDGVILCAGVFGQEQETDVCLLILDAKNLDEVGRSTFSTPGPIPKCLHGWFAPDKISTDTK